MSRGQSADQPSRRRGLSPGWIGAWTAILALALWLAQPVAIWLGFFVLGSALWTFGLARRRDRFHLLVAAVLWLIAGAAVAVQSSLTEIAGDWPGLQLRIEESSAEALGAELDGLLEEGEQAAAGAADAATSLGDDPAASAALFDRLTALQYETGVSAIALYGPDGSTIAWAGEHRGPVPAAARLGTQSYLFQEGPLFSYLYFVRPLPDGITATAAFLLEAGIDVGEGIVPFADRFENAHGTRPQFWIPERARAEAVWDWATDRPILSVSFAELTQQHWWERVVTRGRRAVGLGGLAALLLLSIGWYRARREGSGVPILVGTAGFLIAPLGNLSGSDALFSPLQFVLPGPLDVTLGILLVLFVGAALWILTHSEASPERQMPARAWVPITATLFPLALLLIERSAADGLLAARAAGGAALQVTAVLMIAVPLYLILRHARVPSLPHIPSPLLRIFGFAMPSLLGVAMLFWWRPDVQIPIALAAVWVLPAAALLLALRPSARFKRSLELWLISGWLAGTVVLTFLWPLHVRAELARAERQIAALGIQTDPFLDFLLREFSEQAMRLASNGESGVNLLYHSWVASGLAREGFEARISFWQNGDATAELNLSALPPLSDRVIADVLRPRDQPLVQHYGGAEGLQYLLVVPLDSARTVSVAVPPRRRVAWATPLARFLHPDPDVDPSLRDESLYLVPIGPDQPLPARALVSDPGSSVEWIRSAEGWRSESILQMPEGFVRAHMVVATAGVPLLLVRATLVLAAILAGFLLLWVLTRVICRDVHPASFIPTMWLRSFRGRLSLALFFFFLLPTLVFGAVSYGAVAREVVRSAAELAQRSLDQAAAGMPASSLREVGQRLQTDILMYRQGTLVTATEPELLELGLFHTWLHATVYLRFAQGADLQALDERRVAQNDYLVAYRRLDSQRVLAVPIPLASHEITLRQREFRDIALLVVLFGLALSIMLALLVSRALARPLDELTRAAVTVGAGDFRSPLAEIRRDEFGSVYSSFNRMVDRLRQTRAALVQETRRTETIVAEAATGVLALDANGHVELMNSRASEILGTRLDAGEPLRGADRPIAEAIETMWAAREPEARSEIEYDGRMIRMKLRRLSDATGGGGAVVSLEDVTSELRAARVLAWGEMARQVAHEIKNPLTPIKLAVQHIRRAFIDRRPDFDDILDRNVEAILREIDRLGDIARAFSRFGTPAAVESPLEAVDVSDVIHETLTLYGGSAAESMFRAELPAEPLPPVVARSAELKEVLLNLFENARDAVDGDGEIVISAAYPVADGRVAITVADTGVGIDEAALPRIFDPHFSTRSSGTGLGLAIVRRIVESWGGQVTAESTLGAGTRFEVVLQTARNP